LLRGELVHLLYNQLKHTMKFSINLNELSDTTKEYLLKDPACPPDIFSELARNGSEDIKLRCARDPKCPTEIIQQLVKEGEVYLKDHKEKNRGFLTSSSWGYQIMKVCSFNPNCDTQTVMNILDVIPDEIIHNPAIGEKTLREYYEKEIIEEYCSEVLVKIATNPNCPKDLLVEMASKDFGRFSGSSLEDAIAGNKNTPPQTLVKLARPGLDDDGGRYCDVRRVLAGNENTPIPILYDLIDTDKGYKTSDKARDTLRSIKERLGKEGFEKLEKMHEIMYMGKYFI